MLLLLLLIPIAGAVLVELLPVRATRPLALALTLVNLAIAACTWWWFQADGTIQYRFDIP